MRWWQFLNIVFFLSPIQLFVIYTLFRDPDQMLLVLGYSTPCSTYKYDI